jgi:hypothetical protein
VARPPRFFFAAHPADDLVERDLIEQMRIAHSTTYQRGRFIFALGTAAATLALIGLGGLVTSKGVGMAVPD